MLIFAAFFIVCATILFGAFGQRIQEFLQENVLRMLSRQSSDNKKVGKEVDPSTPSSSSPMTNCGSEFEVFLSFRGADTRKGFTGHLYDALDERGISTFIDSKKLQKGEQIHKLLEYIDKSKIIVVIFSKHYAQSRWCLKELAKSVESRKEIVPVFLGVEPSDVRNQEGTFKSAFQEHESNKELEQAEVKKWRQALSEVGNRSGFNLKDVNGDEAELKRAIIKRVSSTVNSQPLLVAKHPIGIETRVQIVMKMLGNKSEGVHVVGIHGMGGLGKTTIAKAVSNKLAEGFNGATCFLSNVRENAELPNGLVSLQKQVFHEILKDRKTILNNVAHGASLIKERAKHKRVLLVLDDVDSIKQIDALAGGRDWFGLGSVIIITTRDYDVLLAGHVKEDEIYMPEVLNRGQSWELFLRHAFNGEEPHEDYHQLSNKVVAAAGGLPLTLEVIGSLLASRKDVQEWTDTLEKLEKIPNVDVQKTLKLSYDKLENHEKNVFLDISCFFIGRDRWNATYMWQDHDWCPKEAIKVLVQRALIKIDEKTGEFEMHDQLRDMGREIVAEESSRVLEKQSRLWIPQDSLDLLRQKAVFLHQLKVLCLHFCRQLITCPDFNQMPNLERLSFEGCMKMSGLHPSIGLLKKLTHLNLKVCIYLKELPDTIYELTSLKELHLSNCSTIIAFPPQLEDSKSREKHVLGKLKVLYLDFCSNLIMSPDFTKMPNLERLSFSSCVNMSRLHPSIGLLKKLTHLDLNRCHSLKEFPEAIYELISLEELDFSGCAKITTFPTKLRDSKSTEQHVLGKLKVLGLDHCHNLIMCPDFTRMPNLERLSFEKCRKMIGLHPSIGLLKKLPHLNLNGCKSLKELPETIYELTSLEKLDLSSCSKITAFPPQSEDSKSREKHVLGKLKVLDLDFCSNLIMSPNFTKMPNLERLSFSNCENMSGLHPSIGLLKKLTHLDLKHCNSLKEFPEAIYELISLEEFDLTSCAKITTFPTKLGDSKSTEQHVLGKLKVLGLDHCYNLIMCPDFTKMPNLERLSFENCGKMTGLHPSIGLLKKLPCLNLNGCKSLKELPETIYELTSLENFDLSCCSKITAFPPQSEDSKSREKHVLGKLKVLLLKECYNLIMSPDFTKMPNLERISFEDSEKMSGIHPSIGMLKKLTHLNLKGCQSLKELPEAIYELTSLKDLDLRCCKIITALPPQSGDSKSMEQHVLGKLEDLYLDFCSNLIMSPDFTKMPNLVSLSFEECEKMSGFHPSIWGLKHLTCMNLGYCQSLKELPQEIGQKTSLLYLNLSNCSKISTLPPLPPSLIYFEVTGCSQLKELPQEIGQMTSLKCLYLCNCYKISNLPPLPPSLSQLVVRGCSQLESIADVSNVKGLRQLDLTNCMRLVDVLGIEQLVCLECLLLAGCRSLGDSLMERIKAAKLQRLNAFSIPGRLINDEWSYPHSIAFILALPKVFYGGFLYLYVDRSSIDSIRSELNERMSTPPVDSSEDEVTIDSQRSQSVVQVDITTDEERMSTDQSISSEDEIMVDSQRSRSVVQVDITTDEAQFSFSTFFNSWDREVPTATFERDSEMMTLAREGRFEENMVMRVTINGCVILNGDLSFGHSFDSPVDDQYIVAVEFGNW